MFTKSPWARSVTIRLGGMQPSKGSSSTGTSLGGSPGIAGGSPAGGAGSYPQGSGTGYPGGAGGGGFASSLSLTVRWYSALPLNEGGSELLALGLESGEVNRVPWLAPGFGGGK